MGFLPHIFVSSTLTGLKRHRKAVHDLLRDKLKMSPWCFEIDGESEGFPTLDVLAKHIQDSDLFVCIIGADYGSEIGHQPISFTEWEILTAIHYQREIKLYVEECGSLREVRLRSLLAILNDELVGYFTARFNSESDLCIKIERDLSSWNRNRLDSSKQFARVLGNVMDLPIFTHIRVSQSLTNPFSRRSKESSLSESDLQNLSTLKNKGMYGNAYQSALAVLSADFNGGNYLRGAGALQHWADFLSIFSNILAVRNQIRCGDISAVAVAKAEFKARQLLNDMAGMVRAASAASGILNVAGLLPQSLTWNNFALERSQFVLSPHAILDTRSSILRRQRKFAPAEQALQAAISLYDGADDDLGYMFSRLAGIQFSLGKRKSALQNLEKAAKLVKSEGLGMSIYVRELSKILIANHEMREAERQLQVGLAVCNRLGLERPRRALRNIAFQNGISTV